MQLAAQLELSYGSLHAGERELGAVAVLTEMSEDDVLHLIIGYLADEVCGLLVREVSPVASDALDEAVVALGVLEAVWVVVGLEVDAINAFEQSAHLCEDATCVGEVTKAHATTLKEVAYGVTGIVAAGEAGDVDVTYHAA